jgi:hypothetical protein
VRTLVFILVLGAAALASGCRRDCVATCEDRQKTLKCSNTNCKESCGKLHDPPVCKKELAGFEKCLLEQPVDRWECDESREPSLKLGACTPERAAVMKCLESTPPPAAPPPASK